MKFSGTAKENFRAQTWRAAQLAEAYSANKSEPRHPDCVFNNTSIHETIIQEKSTNSDRYESFLAAGTEKLFFSFCWRKSAM